MADTKISALPASTTPLIGTEVLPIVQSSTTKQVSVANLTAGRDVSAKTETLKPRNGVKPTNNSVVTGLTIFNDQDNVTGDGVALFLDHSFGTPGTQTRGVKFRSYGETTYSGYVGAKIQVTNNGSLIESLYLKGSGDVQVTSGNLVIGTSGKGIDFSATSGTGLSELLADYEEGTWTPAVSDGTTSVNGGTGWYIKVGRQVTCGISFYAKDISGLTTSGLRLTLPFANNGAYGSSSSIVGTLTSNYPMIISISGSNTYGLLYAGTSSGGNVSAVTKSSFAASTTASLFGTFVYYV